MIIAMMLTPLSMLFKRARWVRWLMQRRRPLGVAAFGYAALHTIIYVVDMQTLQLMLDEFWALGIWTGWAAFAIFIPLAVTSNERYGPASRKALETAAAMGLPGSCSDAFTLDLCAQ